jgi:predicted TIM-barrel fold metal-dependent hydrolase
VTKATEFGLPVKLHTGYYVGHGFLPLDRLSRNADDVRGLLEDYPDTKFVLMHMGYPYQDEFVALGKHYHNAYVDMCWTWIINPLACVRFLREFLIAAPANKIFSFGGDYEAVELVYGHSEIARQGIAQAFSELVADGWVTRTEAYALIESVMRLNANTVFSRPKNAVPKPKTS